VRGEPPLLQVDEHVTDTTAFETTHPQKVLGDGLALIVSWLDELVTALAIAVLL